MIMKSERKKTHTSARGGFVLLYAILISTVIISIGLSLMNVILEHVSLTGIERESSLSFYAADSAMECALYWDNENILSLQPDGEFHNPPPIDIQCDSFTPSVTSSSAPSGSGTHTHTYTFDVPLPARGTCADVVITKRFTDGDVGPPVVPEQAMATNISVRGYNTPNCPPAAPTKLWRFERGIRVDY